MLYLNLLIFSVNVKIGNKLSPEIIIVFIYYQVIYCDLKINSKLIF